MRRPLVIGWLLGSCALVGSGCADDTCIPQPIGELRVAVEVGDGAPGELQALTYEDDEQGTVDCSPGEGSTWICAVDDIETAFRLVAELSADESVTREYLRMDVDLVDLCSSDAAGELVFVLGLDNG